MISAKSKAILTACALGLACFILPSAAKADTVTIVGAGPNSANGVYVMPYQLQVSSIDGGATINVVCDDYSDEVKPVESWTGSIETVANITGALFAGQANAQENYDKAAWLYSQYQLNPTSYNAIADNFAIWDLFDPSVGNNAVAGEQTALNNAATWYADGATGINFSLFDIITPTSWTCADNPNQSCTAGGGDQSGRPQEYIYDPQPTPEPGSLALFGSGLIGLAGLLRKRLVHNS